MPREESVQNLVGSSHEHPSALQVGRNSLVLGCANSIYLGYLSSLDSSLCLKLLVCILYMFIYIDIDVG